MKRRAFTDLQRPTLAWTPVWAVLLLLVATRPLMAQPTPAAVAAFNTYTARVESRLAGQHRSAGTFLATTPFDSAADTRRLRKGDPIIEQLTPATGAEFSGSLLHHWRGTAFVPGAKASDFERLMQDFKDYPQHFSPQVLAGQS